MIEKIGILSHLNEMEIHELELFCQRKTLQAGELLFAEGDDATAMYILVVGSFEVFRSQDGQKQLLGTVQAEEVLGEMALFGETTRRMASARALVDSELLVILDFSIKEMTQKHPELLQKLKNIITLRNEKNKMKS